MTTPLHYNYIWLPSPSVPFSFQAKTFCRYTRGQGYPRLMNAIAEMYSPEFNRKIDPMSEILASVGAYESLYAAITAFTNPGDEVHRFRHY